MHACMFVCFYFYQNLICSLYYFLYIRFLFYLFFLCAIVMCCNCIVTFIALHFYFLKYCTFIPSFHTHLEQAGWWDKSETMVAPEEGFMLTDSITIVSVTYYGNSPNLKVPVQDNWTCIAQGLITSILTCI